ncbi:uncharacterized protein LOC135216064 isoform X2 [Macrobrachium nipponense]|uniref:uncharacterized protein LOC135216064 isoform X2 n=1 Tax=Macrobrachium nipponense TaxID=159736 RepID=UPI0030C86D6A
MIYFHVHHSVMNTFIHFPKCYCGISSFSSFIRSQVLFTKNEEDQILRKDFGIAYRNYCLQNNLPQASVIDFLGHLMQSGITKKAVEKDNNFYYVFCGVAWKKTKNKNANHKDRGVESTSIAHTLSSYVPRHNGFETFLQFCQSYVVFTLEEEHCVMLEEFEASYKKFCRRYGLKKADLVDMKRALLCTKVKWMERKHASASGEIYCVFFGMHLLKDGITDNNKMEPTQLKGESTPAFKTNDAISAVSKSEILELPEPSVRVFKPRRWVAGVRLEKNVMYFRENSSNYFITANDQQSIAKSEVTSEKEGDSVALDIENDLEYLNCPFRKHAQEVVGKKENIALTYNSDETNKILKSDIKCSVLKENKTAKLCSGTERSLNINAGSVREKFAPLHANSVDNLVCDISLGDRQALYKEPKCTASRSGNRNDPSSVVTGSHVNNCCPLKGIIGNKSFGNVEQSSTFRDFLKKPKRSGKSDCSVAPSSELGKFHELQSSIAGALNLNRWVVGVKLEKISALEGGRDLGKRKEKDLENSSDNSAKKLDVKLLVSGLEAGDDLNHERLSDCGDQNIVTKEDSSAVNFTIKAKSSMYSKTNETSKESSLLVRKNQAQNICNADHIVGDDRSLEENECGRDSCAGIRERDDVEMTEIGQNNFEINENSQSNRDSKLPVFDDKSLASDFDCQGNSFSTFPNQSDVGYLPLRSNLINHNVSVVENRDNLINHNVGVAESTFDGCHSFSEAQREITSQCMLEVSLHDIFKCSELKNFCRSDNGIKLEEPDVYPLHDSESYNMQSTIEEDSMYMMNYLRENGKPDRFVSEVLLRDIRRYPQYQKKLHFYKDEIGDWILIRPSFTYYGLDSFKKFIKANICFTGKPHNLIMRDDLFRVYQKFCGQCSLPKASLKDIEHHLSVIGIRSHYNYVQSFSPEIAFSGLKWKHNALLKKFGNNNFSVIIHDL